jgi:IclR family transcriptional regulator, KDG regulon repressor
MELGEEGKATAIEKALQILMLFQPHNPEMGTTEISQLLSYHKATVSRILLTLTRQGFLRQDPRTKTFSLGPSVLHLAWAVKQSLRTNLVEIARPHINALRDAVNETTTFEILSGSVTVLAYLAEGTRAVRTTTYLGATLPAHAAAGAKAILAHVPPDVWAPAFAQGVEALTAQTITDGRTFARQLEQVKERGFAVDDEEVDLGVTAVAAPVFDHEGRPVAAVVVVGPSDRVASEPVSDLVARVKKTARNVSADLHYVPGKPAEPAEPEGARRSY